MSRGARAAVVIWLIAMIAGGAWLARHLVITTDLSAFLPPAATPAQEVLVGQLRSGLASRLLLIGIEGGDERALARTSGQLAERLAASGLFETVANGDPARATREREALFAMRYALSPGVTAQRFSAEGLRAALQEEMELLASPLGMAFRNTLAADPTGELRRLASPLIGSGGPATRHGAWISADGKRALLVAETSAPAFDIDAQTRAAASVRNAFATITSAGMKLQLAGPGLAAVAARAAIERDAQQATLFSMIGVLLILFAAYRSPLPVVLSALPAISGLLIGVSAVSLWFGPVHGITLAFGAILVGEAVDYPTYLYAHAARGEPLESTLARIGPTLRLAVLTTACGAIAMLLSSFRGLAQLGLLTLVGVGTSGLVTRFVLPALTPARTLQKKLVRVPLEAVVPVRSAGANLWLVLLPVLASAAVLIAKADHVWDDDLANLSPLPAEVKAFDAELRKQLGAPDVRHLLVVFGADREQVLQKSERMIGLLDRAVADGWIERYDIAARYLPSERTQALRKAALPDAKALAVSLEQGMQGLPFRPDLFAPFLADVQRARDAPPVDAAAWRGTAFAPRLERLLAPGAKGWTAFAPLSGVRDGPALDRAIRANGDPDVLLLDLKREADGLVAGYRLESLRLFALGVLCIALVVYAGLRSIVLSLRVLVPVLAAAMLDVATLVASGTGLTVVHLVALLMVVGVGLNYGLFFNRRQGDPGEESLTRLSLVVASLATLCGSIALMTCSTPVLRAIGVTIAIGTVYAFALAAVFARPDTSPDRG